MVQKVGNAAVNYNETEILYIAENWIAQEQTLDDGRKTVDLVKNRGHVHEQQGKDIVQICDSADSTSPMPMLKITRQIMG